MLLKMIKKIFCRPQFVSEIDQFLTGFDAQHPTISAAVKAEKAKHDKIYYLRDTANPTSPEKKDFDL